MFANFGVMGSPSRCRLSTLELLSSISLMTVFSTIPAATGNRRPHIIFIIADDMGWNDVSVHGSQLLATPHVDALAAAGRLLQRHYALPTCTPSRAALLTGRHAAATGMQGLPQLAGEPRGLPPRERTLPERLRARGYATHLVGKWHLGSHRPAFLPTRRGFDSHYGYRNGFVGYFDHSTKMTLPTGEIFSGLDFWRNESPDNTSREYLTHAFTREATRLIRDHAGSSPERPLFLLLAHLAVHAGNETTPLEVPDEAAAHRRFAYEKDAERRIYAEMVSQMDESVGTVLAALRDTAMLNDSIVVFLSDNGGITVGIFYNTGSNWPFRGTKHTVFEGGVRTVGAVWSPRMRALRTPYPHPLHISDWLPTLLAAADEGAPGGRDGSAANDQAEDDIFAGVSHWQALCAPVETEEVDFPPREMVLLNVDDVTGHSGVMSGRWKYVKGTDPHGNDGHIGDPARGSGYPVYDAAQVAQVARDLSLDSSLTAHHVQSTREAAAVSCNSLQDTLASPPCAEGCLFDLQEDPCEMRDVSAREPEQLKRLRALLGTFQEQQAEQLNQPVDPRSNPALHGGVWAPWLPDVTDDDCEDDKSKGKKGEGNKGEGNKGENKKGEGNKSEGNKSEGKKSEGKKGEGKKDEGDKCECNKGKYKKGEGEGGKVEGDKGECNKGKYKKGEGKGGKVEGDRCESNKGEHYKVRDYKVCSYKSVQNFVNIEVEKDSGGRAAASATTVAMATATVAFASCWWL